MPLAPRPENATNYMPVSLLGDKRKAGVLYVTPPLCHLKPGGLTSSECLAVGLPMLVVSPIPGQEERNADYLLEAGAALKAHDLAGVDYRMRELLKNPRRIAAMRERALAVATPHAAQSIWKCVLNG